MVSKALAVSKALTEIDRLRSVRSETQSHIRKMTELAGANRQVLFELSKSAESNSHNNYAVTDPSPVND